MYEKTSGFVIIHTYIYLFCVHIYIYILVCVYIISLIYCTSFIDNDFIYFQGTQSLNPHNDYCQHFVDTGHRPQNFIRDVGECILVCLFFIIFWCLSSIRIKPDFAGTRGPHGDQRLGQIQKKILLFWLIVWLWCPSSNIQNNVKIICFD